MVITLNLYSLFLREAAVDAMERKLNFEFKLRGLSESKRGSSLRHLKFKI
jgi:hypothetical protein